MYGSVRGAAGNSGPYRDNQLCAAPEGPFRQLVPDPFNATQFIVCFSSIQWVAVRVDVQAPGSGRMRSMNPFRWPRDSGVRRVEANRVVNCTHLHRPLPV